jgi:hypothetical protein
MVISLPPDATFCD